jgi:hypothetical protein
MISLSTFGAGTLVRTAAMSSCTAAELPGMGATMSMTMPISSAPCSMAPGAAVALTLLWCLPLGKRR